MRRFALVCAALALAACASAPQYTRTGPAKPQAEMQADMDACNLEAVKARAGNPDPMVGAVAGRQVLDACMVARGYRRQYANPPRDGNRRLG